MQTSARPLELCNQSPPPDDVDTEFRVIVPFNKEVNINGFPFLFERCENYLWVSDILSGTQSQYCHHTLATMLRASTTTTGFPDDRASTVTYRQSHPYILNIPADEHDVSTVRVELRALGDHFLIGELGDPPKVHVRSFSVVEPGNSETTTGDNHRTGTVSNHVVPPIAAALAATGTPTSASTGDFPAQAPASAAPATAAPIPTATTTTTATPPQSATEASSPIAGSPIAREHVAHLSTQESVSATVSRPPIVNAVPGTTAAAVAALATGISRMDCPSVQNTPSPAPQSAPAADNVALGCTSSLASASCSHSTSSTSSVQTTSSSLSSATSTPREDPVCSITVADPALPFLARLPVVTVTTRMAARCEVCVICTHDYTEGNLVRRLPCFHAFHQFCIDAWLRESTRTQTCPLCKQCVRAMVERSDATAPWIREEEDEESKTWRK